MAGSDYEWCPICERKALYVGDLAEEDLDRVEVVHRSCWALISPDAIEEAARAVKK